MAEPNFAYQTIGAMAYGFSQVAPYLPSAVHMIVAAMLPIFAGSHASLSRPRTAAKPSKRRLRRDGESLENLKIEGLTTTEALLFPVLAGLTLGGLYLLIKWFDPALISKWLNWFMSFVGVFATTTFLDDSLKTLLSFIFPRRYYDAGFIWELNQNKKCFEPVSTGRLTLVDAPKVRNTPLAGAFYRLQVPPAANNALWKIRSFLKEPFVNLKLKVPHEEPILVRVTSTLLLAFVTAMSGILYLNLVDKPWWLMNILGFSLSYNALQTMSPTTFGTGSLLLSGLFFYDIYMVFYTPLMITVATKLDIPAKLTFPRPSFEGESKKVQHMSMIGLGDIVIPGVMIALALRFDLYTYYQKLQRRRDGTGEDNETNSRSTPSTTSGTEDQLISPLVYGKDGIGKAEYKPAGRNWGERFWLGRKNQAQEGSNFPKTYFYAGLSGYLVALVITDIVIYIYRRGQPALLYLVPGVLGGVWGTALWKGELGLMWEYSELDEEDKEKQKAQEEAVSKKEEARKRNSSSPEVKETPDNSDDEDSAPSSPMNNSKGKKDPKAATKASKTGFFSGWSISATQPSEHHDEPVNEARVREKQSSRLSDAGQGFIAVPDSDDSWGSEELDDVPSSPEFVERNTQIDVGPGAKRRRIT